MTASRTTNRWLAICLAIVVAVLLVACGDIEESTDSPDRGSVTTQATESSEAHEAAKSYLEYAGFSRAGLIKQLEFEGFSTADATKAVDNLDVDWNVEAVQSAQSYLETGSFSQQGLVEQLAYEGFTPEQAAHGAATALGG